MGTICDCCRSRQSNSTEQTNLLNTDPEENTMYICGKNYAGELGTCDNEPVISLTASSISNIEHIFCGNEFNIFICNDGSILSAGSNEYGSCAIDRKFAYHYIIKPINYFHDHNIKIKTVCTSVCGHCVLWITNKNKLYMNGPNGKHQISQICPNKTDIFYEPVLIDCFNNVIDGASATNYSLVLCSTNISPVIQYWFRQYNDFLVTIIESYFGNTNKVYSTSYSEDGGNGHGYDCMNDRKWKYIHDAKWTQIETLKDIKIIQVEAGEKHSVFLESNGNVWTAGTNYDGELGVILKEHNYRYNSYIPIKIEYFEKNNIRIKKIKCGGNHTLAVDQFHRVWVWGSNYHGQCGIGGQYRCVHIPQLIEDLKNCKINKIECGVRHSYVCTENDDHYFFGDNYYSECVSCEENVHVCNNICKDKPCVVNEEINKQMYGRKVKNVYLGDDITMILTTKCKDLFK